MPVSPQQRVHSLDTYLQQVGESSLLPANRTDPAPLTPTELAAGTLRLVVKQASRYSRATDAHLRAELISAGNLGLMQAAHDYYASHTKQTFLAFAEGRIIRAIQQALRLHHMGLKMSPANYFLWKKVQAFARDYQAEFQHLPTSHQVAKQLNLRKLTAKRLLSITAVVSLDAPAGSESTTTIGEVTAAPGQQEPSHTLDRERLLAIMQATLTERELGVLLAHYGFNGEPQTLGEVALGMKHSYNTTLTQMTKQAVHLIAMRALKKLRKAVRNAT